MRCPDRSFTFQKFSARGSELQCVGVNNVKGNNVNNEINGKTPRESSSLWPVKTVRRQCNRNPERKMNSGKYVSTFLNVKRAVEEIQLFVTTMPLMKMQ